MQCTVLLSLLAGLDSEFSEASQHLRELFKSKTKKLVDRDRQHLRRLSHDPPRTHQTTLKGNSLNLKLNQFNCKLMEIKQITGLCNLTSVVSFLDTPLIDYK